ncbi:MAG: TonB family protein [Maribacter sp.]
MIQYILECIAFQLVFLIIYDFFLKRETFFQWNRAYLIGTYVLSLLLPWIKIEAFRTEVPQVFNGSSEFFWNLDQEPVLLNPEVSQGISLTWKEGFFLLGVLLASVWFILKMWRLYQLRTKGIVNHFKSFTQILVPDSHIAFSFFKSIFLGEKLPRKEYEAIISHELVHIKQRHSLDLLFFELTRILNWFNPLVYVYQNRIAELHEFIADAQVPKSERKAHYDLLLSQVFQTQNISFVNQFFKSSLIKKRIVMLQKTKSKRIWQLKYLVLVPILLGMLVYTSCENNPSDNEKLGEVIAVYDIENMTIEEEKEVFTKLIDLSVQPKDWEFVVKDQHSTILFTKPNNESSFISGPGGTPIKASMQIDSKILDEDFSMFDTEKGIKVKLESMVPFAVVDEVPVFPGCENDDDKRGCFFENMREHIRKNFNYPKQAQEKGIQGMVNTMFIIDEKGGITNVKMRGPDSLLTNEATRIISRLPIMKPGIHEGEVVKVAFSIPITFRLQATNGWEPDLEKFADMTENIPIFYIDGERVTKEQVMAMNQDEIESIFTLKGEVAIKKYGQEAQNGVLEIITKKKD